MADPSRRWKESAGYRQNSIDTKWSAPCQRTRKEKRFQLACVRCRTVTRSPCAYAVSVRAVEIQNDRLPVPTGVPHVPEDASNSGLWSRISARPGSFETSCERAMNNFVQQGQRESGADFLVPRGRSFITLLEAFRATGGTVPGEIVGRLLEEHQVGKAVSLAKLIYAGQAFGRNCRRCGRGGRWRRGLQDRTHGWMAAARPTCSPRISRL